MPAFVRGAFCFFFILSSFPAGAAQDDLLVSVFDKPNPESKQDLLAIQRRAVEIAQKVIPCTVGLVAGSAMGSGVVISEDGYILTAAHVVARPGRPVTVRFPDGRRAKAISLGMYTSADGALVKITDDGDWPFVPLIPADDGPKVGEWCLAAGHPAGFDSNRQPPVRVGRVVSIGPTLLRTDCPVTSGDSGGPLMDMQGRVIGIHSRITESITENYHVPGLAYRKAWDSLMKSELYPKPIPSRFLAMLDADSDGKLTRKEMKSSYHREVYDRLVEEFGLDDEKPLSLKRVASDTFDLQAVSVPLDEIISARANFNELKLHSRDFVRGPKISKLLQVSAREASQLTVRVYADGGRVALGTVIDAEGYVMTKASRLDHEDIECLFSDGTKLPAKLAGVNTDYDVALLKVNGATNLSNPNWTDVPPKPGSWVSIPKTRGRLASLGVVAVSPRSIERARPFLGIAIDQNVITEAVVTDVVSRSGAERAGVEPGDVVLKVAGKKVSGLDDIKSALKEYHSGNTVEIVLRRRSQEKTLDVQLRSPSDIGQASPWDTMEGRKSRRRDGFDSVFQMDAILTPELCGGPVVDVEGRIVGVTVARASRVASYGVDYKSLKPVIETLKNQSKKAILATSADQNEVKK